MLSDAEFEAEQNRRQAAAAEAAQATPIKPLSEMTDQEFAAETLRRKTVTDQAAVAAKAEKEKNKPDKYYAIKTGDTLDSIAKELNHEGEGQALFDYAHDGGVSNGELVAAHSNLIRGANGDARDERGALVPVFGKEHVTTKTKLVEGQSLLLPKGW
jgi:hypothetical protein